MKTALLRPTVSRALKTGGVAMPLPQQGESTTKKDFAPQPASVTN